VAKSDGGDRNDGDGPRWLRPAIWAHVVITIAAVAWLVVRWRGRFP
jgi:hypothetical protein